MRVLDLIRWGKCSSASLHISCLSCPVSSFQFPHFVRYPTKRLVKRSGSIKNFDSAACAVYFSLQIAALPRPALDKPDGTQGPPLASPSGTRTEASVKASRRSLIGLRPQRLRLLPWLSSREKSAQRLFPYLWSAQNALGSPEWAGGFMP